jgi:DNA-binding MarR family transcriptional regulator
MMDDKEKIIHVIESISDQLLKSKMSLMDNVKGVELSSIHFQYIHVLDKLGETNFTELSKELQISKPAVTALINKLLNQNIIEKFQSDYDKRSYNIKLTERGKEIATIYNNSLMSFAGKLKTSMTNEEFKQLIKLLEKIA